VEDQIETLRLYLVMTDQGIHTSLNRIEVLTETLREIVPGFAEEHAKQVQKQAERRAEQEKLLAGQPTLSADHIFEIVQRLLRNRSL